jgi:NTP pyrophosphatase (non-canonical NTP hydrolase)
MEQCYNSTANLLTINQLKQDCHANAVKKGFWDEERNPAEAMMLVVCECAEVVEAMRVGSGLQSEKVGEECADIIIRMMDFCGGFGIDIETAIWNKMQYNKTRPIMHGKKF